MKPVVILALCLGLIFFCWNFFLAGEFSRDKGHWIPVAFGGSREGMVQMHLAVAPGLPLVDPPETDHRNHPKWDERIAAHFELIEEQGEKIRLTKIGTSGLFTGEPAAGAPEFALTADVLKGHHYLFDYIPSIRKGKRYRFSFKAPEEPQKVGMKQFDPTLAVRGKTHAALRGSGSRTNRILCDWGGRMHYTDLGTAIERATSLAQLSVAMV